jgi:small conductance mechanosensitive channel
MDDFLNPETLQALIPYLVRFATAIVLFVVGWLVSKWVHSIALKLFRRSRLDEALARFFAAAAQYTVLAFVVIAALDKVGVETTSLAAVIAAAGFAVGLALQGSLSNFASGVLLLFFRPFTLGDRVTAGGHTGKVQDLGMFATTLTTPSNERILLPNAEVMGNAIINHTAAGKVRATIAVGVAYGADIDQVSELLLEAARSAEHVLEEPSPAVAFVDMAASSLNFVVNCWAEVETSWAMQHNVRRAVYNKLNEAGVEIPFDQLVVHKGE